jgi:GNAT superfamily N-acetyltransferase
MTELHVRAAQPADLASIETLVIGMFRELGTTAIPTSWSIELRQALAVRLGLDVAAYITVEQTGEPIAVAVGIVDQRLPSPRRPTGRVGYVEWLATAALHRRRGAARMAMSELLRWFDGRGIETVDVHASDAARPLYVEFGFSPPAAIPLRRSTGGRSTGGLETARYPTPDLLPPAK